MTSGGLLGPEKVSFACAFLLVERVRSSRHNAGLLRLLMSSFSGRGFLFLGAVVFGAEVENAVTSLKIDSAASSDNVVFMVCRISVYFCLYLYL